MNKEIINTKLGFRILKYRAAKNRPKDNDSGFIHIAQDFPPIGVKFVCVKFVILAINNKNTPSTTPIIKNNK